MKPLENLHRYKEYELILVTQGSGIITIGDYEEKYEAGNIYFVDNNLQQAFQSERKESMIAVVIQFSDNFLGNHFMNLPECKSIQELLTIARFGLKITGNCKLKLEIVIKALETATGLRRIIMLLQCLDLISTTNEYIVLAKKKVQIMNIRGNIAINKVIEFTKVSFHDQLSLSQVAAIACMSVPSFCNYFKHCIGKTYINFLNEVRISHACQLLQETNLQISEIAYLSGYNTIAHFHRQFIRILKITPFQYRKEISTILNNGEQEFIKVNNYKFFNVAC